MTVALALTVKSQWKRTKLQTVSVPSAANQPTTTTIAPAANSTVTRARDSTTQCNARWRKRGSAGEVRQHHSLSLPRLQDAAITAGRTVRSSTSASVAAKSSPGRDREGTRATNDPTSPRHTTWLSLGRRVGAFYATHPDATDAILDREPPLAFPIWGPAMRRQGDNETASRPLPRQEEVYSSDLYDRGYGQNGVDFLTCPTPVRSQPSSPTRPSPSHKSS